MIKCSHLTPKSIYSYIDDLVIANCLIDARIVCACFVTYFIYYLIVWACWLHNFSIRGHPFVVLIFLVFIDQMDGQECLRTSSSYLCFFSSQILFMLHHKNWRSFFRTLRVRRTRSHRSVKGCSPKPSCDFWSDQLTHIRSQWNHQIDQDFHLGDTD
jgi:hypothetical protein